jgi:hypothetical protein
MEKGSIALSEVVPAIERAGLLVTDIEILRLHCAATLAAWHDRFLAHRDDVERIYDARFVRMWEFYLAGAETAFRHRNLMVFQMARRHDAVPITRDHIMRAETRLRLWKATTGRCCGSPANRAARFLPIRDAAGPRSARFTPPRHSQGPPLPHREK